jgi:hypothetical protein
MNDLIILKFWNAIAIFRLGVLSEYDISLQDFRHPMIFRQNVEESCMFQKIYGVGNINLQTKRSGILKKITNLVEYLKDIN